MSSGDDADAAAGRVSKKRRLRGACDYCRQRKIRCDSAMMPENRCTYCLTHNIDCTHLATTLKNQKPDQSKSYVQKLEERLAKLESLLSQLSPGTDLGAMGKDLASAITPGSTTSTRSTNNPIDPTTSNFVKPMGSKAPEAFTETELPDAFKELSLKNLEDRFFGKNSSWFLMKQAVNAKKAAAGRNGIYPPIWSSRRMEFWSTLPWEHLKVPDTPQYKFPENDLLLALVDLYFRNINDFMPLFHRPTFQNAIEEGLHFRDRAFGSTVLLVCALGSRYSDDQRVFVETAESPLSAGWEWFEQVKLFDNHSGNVPAVYDLQAYSLYVLFLTSSSIPHAGWRLIGIGIRLAQEVGAHRKRSPKNSLNSELSKRAFWGLLVVDRFTSAFLGRPCATYDEHVDLDLPADCDDEFWETPNSDDAFKQPPNKPSSSSFFISFLKLYEILGHAQRTILSTSKSRVPRGESLTEWEQRTVVELDSELNEWVDSIPDHLRWDPHRADGLFFDQSAHLYASYYHVQILIHRPFLPIPGKTSPMSFPSLAICANSARSCCHVLYTHSQRKGALGVPMMQSIIQVVGIILLLNIWEGKRSGISIDPAKEMVDVYKCTQLLKANETRWVSAGRAWDTLYELAFVSQLPLPSQDLQRTQKRQRHTEDESEEIGWETSVSTLAVSHERAKAVSHVPNLTSFTPGWGAPQMNQESRAYEPGRLPDLSDDPIFPALPAESSTYSNLASNQDSFPSFPVDQEFYDQMSLIFSNSLNPGTGLGSMFDFSGIQAEHESMLGGSAVSYAQTSTSMPLGPSGGFPPWMGNIGQL